MENPDIQFWESQTGGAGQDGSRDPAGSCRRGCCSAPSLGARGRCTRRCRGTAVRSRTAVISAAPGQPDCTPSQAQTDEVGHWGWMTINSSGVVLAHYYCYSFYNFLSIGTGGLTWELMTTISPGETSRTRSKPLGPKAQSSEATHHSSPHRVCRFPSTSGLTIFIQIAGWLWSGAVEYAVSVNVP